MPCSNEVTMSNKARESTDRTTPWAMGVCDGIDGAGR